VEAQVVELRQKHRAWGGRKIQRRLRDMGQTAVPSASAITGILWRHDLIDTARSEALQKPQRFEHAAPNDLWQMDFKGHFPLLRAGSCHPLTVLDDHSRFSLVLKACGNETGQTVQTELIQAFRRYGLPRRILCDNGAPWGSSGSCGSAGESWTRLGLWLLRLGVGITHGRAYHPQTQGKEERFHRTFKAEVLRWQMFETLGEAQEAFDPWREIYNGQRPHEALGMAVPATRYQCSPRSYPERLPPVSYDAGELVRKVSGNSGIQIWGQRFGIGQAFRGQEVALRATGQEAIWDVYYCQQQIGQIDRRNPGPMQRRAADPLAALTPAGDSP
jgi:transposase InsO family protein